MAEESIEIFKYLLVMKGDVNLFQYPIRKWQFSPHYPKLVVKTQNRVNVKKKTNIESGCFQKYLGVIPQFDKIVPRLEICPFLAR